jgi:hypothetical protein
MAVAVHLIVFGTLLLLCVILPNSFKEVAAGALVLAGLMGAITSNRRFLQSSYFKYYLMGLGVTVLYILVGMANHAPDMAIAEVAIIYIVAPVLWGLASLYALERFGLERIVKWLSWGALFGAISVAYYFWAYANLGPQAVEFMFEEPNVHISEEGYAAARMYVYGSMIFLLGGLLAAPRAINNSILRLVVIGACVMVTLTSGRGALVVTIPLGLLVGTMVGLMNRKHAARIVSRSAVRLATAAVLSLGAAWALWTYFEIDVTVLVEQTIEKLISSGGAGRSDQLEVFVHEIQSDYGLGRGFGQWTEYTVSDEQPWRYELIWVASIFRVGIVGALLYALPFFMALWHGGKRLIAGQMTDAERFLFGGFVCAFFASNTNPYIEGIVFQWMYVLPVVYFCDLLARRRSDGGAYRGHASSSAARFTRSQPAVPFQRAVHSARS